MRIVRRLVVAAALLTACQKESPPGEDFYTRTIQPILDQNCSRGTSGCHSVDAADPFAFAAGNLDTTSFENVHKRPDLLRTYGTYPVPQLLIKAVGPTTELQVGYRGDFLDLEVLHANGATLSVRSEAYRTLQDWLNDGATRDGVAPPDQAVIGTGPCSETIPADFDPAVVTGTPQWADHSIEFAGVQAVIDGKGCNAGNCHGAPQSDFYLTCGGSPDQIVFNFYKVWAFVNDPADDSEVLRRPLPPSLGGVSHSGGVHWDSREDPDYVTIRDWAANVGMFDFAGGEPGKEFFANDVMPVLLRRGCAAEACHSPAAMNDFKLRAGAYGFFSAVALDKNYELAKREFMAFEAPDVRRGRIVAKNIFPVNGGIPHRGGPVLETGTPGGARPENCPQPYDPATASAFCVFVEWSRIERAELAAAGEVDLLPAGATVPIVYVERDPTDVADPLEFDDYQPDSDLLVVDATLDANGAVVSSGVGGLRSLLDTCAGAADRTVVDVRAPDVAPDGVSIAFAMRTGVGEGLQIYTVNLDGTGCARLTTPEPDQNGIKIHNFDPAWSPDGASIVYASTRGGAGGPSLSRRRNLPQADIWRMTAAGANPERVTVLSNSEISPQFMREGRVTMTTEKVDPAGGEFYQLAGRRINWDLTDYHPLLAQRAISPFADGQTREASAPSIGYQQATEIREAMDGDFLLILSDSGARGGAGTLAVFNRSIGPFQLDRVDPGYLASVQFPDQAATGRGTTDGAYRSPVPLLDGSIMASYAAGTFDLNTVGSLDWDLVAVNPRTGARTTILAAPRAQLEAVLALKYPPRRLYLNRRQLVFGGSQDADSAHAVVHFPDAPMLATLLDANLRRGRPIAAYRGATSLVFLDADGAAIGMAPLASDGSARVRVPAGVPVVIRLASGAGTLFTMTEEHQFGPGENISIGVPEQLFDFVCAGCHGSVSGREIDIAVRPDSLTGASVSASAGSSPLPVGP